MQPNLTPLRIAGAAEFWADREQAAREHAAEHAEARAEQLADMARARLKVKLSTLSHEDLVAGLQSVSVDKHGPALRAAWLESAEALGDLLMSVVAHEMSVEAELEAEEALIRIEGAAREEAAPRHRTFVIAGV